MSTNNTNINKADLTGAALSEEERAGLVNALKDKLQNLAGQHPDMMKGLGLKVRERVERLRGIQAFCLDEQSQHDEIEAKFFEERAALEAKYQKLYQPFYNQRYEIVNGVSESEAAKEDAIPAEGDKVEAAEGKGVPDFWLLAMQNNDVVSDQITEKDEGALKFLKDIKWSRVEEPKGFKLEFFFAPNPYFKNTVLTKAYHMIDEDDPILERATGTEIEWYPGKSLTHKILRKKTKKGSKNAKPVTKTEDCESFFNFFNPPQVPEDDEVLDEDVAEELQNQMEEDYDVGSTIRDKIIPHAVSWYTGEAVQPDGLDTDDDDDDDDFDIDDEDDEDDDDEDGIEEVDEVGDDEARNKNISRPHASEIQPQSERPQECRQQ
ncbi:Nucleosome assembly protein 1;2 [Linum grandiflorum]